MQKSQKYATDSILQLGRIAVQKLKKGPSENLQERIRTMVEMFLENPIIIGDLRFELDDNMGIHITEGGTKTIKDAVHASWAQVSTYILNEKNTVLQNENAGLLYVAQGLRDLAYYDPLTGLPNRILFGISVEAMSTVNPVTALVTDIDDLKKINTSHGHDGGDAAISHVGKVLGDVVKAYNANTGSEKAIPVRLSGDEFAVAIPGDETSGIILAQLFHRALDENPMYFKDALYPIAVTIGIATRGHTDLFPIEIEQKEIGAKIPLWFAKIMKHADTALEIAHKGTIKVFDGSASSRSIDPRNDKIIEELKDELRGINTDEEFNAGTKAIQAILAKII